MEKANRVYALIGNIPPTYHSADLRNYFSQFIETSGFDCFHFRHRPESSPAQSSKSASASGSKDDRSGKTNVNKGSTCCVVWLKEQKLRQLIKNYHRRHWLDKNGDPMTQLCFISKIRTPALDSDQDAGAFHTRAEQKTIPAERETFTVADLANLAELHPPDVMPNGNVGTPTMVFLDSIRQCRLPPNIIKKLGLTFPKTRTNKKYGNVPYDYGGETITLDLDDDDIQVVSGAGHEIVSDMSETVPVSLSTAEEGSSGRAEAELDRDNCLASGAVQITGADQSKRRKPKQKDTETKQLMDEQIEEKMIAREHPAEDSEEDADACEEWERHEALYDDVSNQERNKERLFEEDIELKWEKGGSGLVFYTDAQYWQAQEGDFDEQTADDYDVDMSVYYEEGAGDKDARDFITLRQDKRRRDGVEQTDRFTSGIAKKQRKKAAPDHVDTENKIGRFESHTKGIGRKILEGQGWSDGQGLGSSVKGIADALDNDGQNPRDRKGFGYRGEKLVRYTGPAERKVLISTMYDDPKLTDPHDPLLRRNGPYMLTYRDEVPFTKSSDAQESDSR